MNKRDVPSRHQWLPSALPQLFGKEHEVLDPWPGLLDSISKFAELSAAIRNSAIDVVADLDEADPRLLDLQAPPSSQLDTDSSDLNAPMRVVLMGRTMAGKSSLLSALTGGSLDRVGDGRQRFSRDVFSARATASVAIEIVDTPGVGARDGAGDFETAFRAAIEADLILWVSSSDSIQEETARALRLLGVIGKPIVVALNCRQSLEGIGKLNLLRYPERVFGNREGLVDEIKRHMAASAVEPLDVVYVHALAAIQSLGDGPLGTELHSASRIVDLVDVLLREHASHNKSRRALRLVDDQRLPAAQTASSLSNGAAALRAQAKGARAMTADIHSRLSRVIRSAHESMNSEIDTAVGRRRDWHLTVTDFGDSLSDAWKAEVLGLQETLDNTLEDRLSALAAEVDATIANADAEWATVSPERFALGELHGFDEVWGNRLLRAGVGLGGAVAGGWAGLQAGAYIGGAVGLSGGPAAVVTAVVGGIIGLGVGLALEPLKGLVDRLFLGRDGVLKKRRDEVSKQVGPILDELAEKYTVAVADRLGNLRERLAEEGVTSEERATSVDRAAARWTQDSESLRALISELDKETTSALLRIAGRERLARSVRRSTRVPGVCILTELDPAAFWEAWLFPPDLGEKLVAGKAAFAGGEAAGSLSYGLSLLEKPVTSLRANSASATLLVHEDVPAGIVQTWADALSEHVGKHIHIETTGKVSRS